MTKNQVFINKIANVKVTSLEIQVKLLKQVMAFQMKIALNRQMYYVDKFQNHCKAVLLQHIA